MENKRLTFAFCSPFFIVLFGFIMGYFLARIKFKGSKIIWIMLLMGMLIPVHSLLVPIYVVFNKTGLSNQWFTLIIPYVAFGLPISVFLCQGFIKEIPTALEEAAAIDGCSFSGTLFKVIMPICKPIMITVAILQTFSCWNEFSFALVLIKDTALQTVYRTVLFRLSEDYGGYVDYYGTDCYFIFCIQQTDY